MGGLPIVERLQAIELGPDDVLVVTLPDDASMTAFDRIRTAFRDALPGRQVLVTSSNIGLSVYRPSGDAEPEVDEAT